MVLLIFKFFYTKALDMEIFRVSQKPIARAKDGIIVWIIFIETKYFLMLIFKHFQYNKYFKNPFPTDNFKQ